MSKKPLQATASYAAYYNVARHNLLLALNHIAEKAGLGSIQNDQDLLSHPLLMQLENWGKTQEKGSSVSDKDIRVLRQVMVGLQKSLPILGSDFAQKISGQLINQDIQAQGQSPRHARDGKGSASESSVTIRTWRAADMHKVLKLLISALMEHRNFFSHAYQAPVTCGRKDILPNLLGLWFDAARRKAKERFEFLEKDIEHLLRHDGDTKKENLNLPHALLMPFERTYQLSHSGAAFLCCLFLDKQQGIEFLKQLDSFKHGTGRAHQATLRTYTHWSIRLPFVRIETNSDTQSLALDVFNELARCPVEVFEQLPEADKKKFVVQPDAEWASDAADDGEGAVTHFVRHTDRFVALSMACLDNMANTNEQYETGIRFMLDLGDFYHHVYDKKLPDGSVDIRRLKQKVLRFGLLPQALEQQSGKPAAWLALEQEKTERDYSKPYIVKTRPHYHLTEQGSIPIKLKENCEASLYPCPVLDAQNPGNYETFDGVEPDFWLSPHELSSLAFYQHLRLKHELPRNNFPQVHDLFKVHRANLMRLYEAIQAQPTRWLCSSPEQLATKLQAFSAASFYTLLPQDLPSNLQALLLQQAQQPTQRLQNQAHNTLQLLLDDGAQRLEAIKEAKDTIKERIKPGKRAHRALRAGEMATFVAKDILRMQPTQDEGSPHKGKPTSILADLLQARLAYFGREKNSLPALFESLHLTANPNPDKNHPFLSGIDLNAPRMNGIAQFYETYLLQRQRYLKDCLQQLAQGKLSLQSPKLAWLNLAQLPERLERTHDLARLLAHYIDPQQQRAALNLPRGLFRQLTAKALHSLDAGLSVALRKEENDSQANGRHLSLSTVVSLYVVHISNDASQDFYFPAETKLEEKIAKIDDKLKDPKADREGLLQVRKKYIQQSHDFNRTCNRYTTQDQVLFLMSKWLIDIKRSATKKGKDLAAKPQDTSMFDKVKLQTLSREDLNDMVPHSVTVQGKTIYVDEIKAKNIGKFKSLSRDRRLPGLLHYYPAERIHFSMVQHELQAYPRAQNQAFEHVLAFERQQNKKTKTQASEVQDNSLHGHLLELALKKSHLPRAQQEQLQAELLTLRNAFCHNEVPTPHSGRHAAQAADMLHQAQQQLSPPRQQGDGIDPIKGDKQIAKHFAQTLEGRYQKLPNRKERNHD